MLLDTNASCKIKSVRNCIPSHDLNQVVFFTKPSSATVHVCFCHCCVRTWAPEFILLGGYDQEPGIMPSSQQDEDLKKRAWNAAVQLARVNDFERAIISKRDVVVNETQLQKKATESSFSNQLFINQI